MALELGPCSGHQPNSTGQKQEGGTESKAGPDSMGGKHTVTCETQHRQVRTATVRVPWPLTVPLPVWLSDPNPPWHCTPLTQSYLPPKPDILSPSCPQPYRPMQNPGFSKHTLGLPQAPQPVLLSCLWGTTLLLLSGPGAAGPAP